MEKPRAGLSVCPDAGGEKHGHASLAYVTSVVPAGPETLFLWLAGRVKLLLQLSQCASSYKRADVVCGKRNRNSILQAQTRREVFPTPNLEKMAEMNFKSLIAPYVFLFLFESGGLLPFINSN